MAEASSALDPNQFNCPICLDLLKDPVTIGCGHSYCMSCIKSCWNQEDHLGVYRCPQCRQTFVPRPVLGRNTMLAEVVETLKNTGLQAATPADHYAGPGDVECDVCTGRKHKAVKSCLVCLASYCETHLQPHYESPAFKKHKLIDATGHLQDKVCSHHDKPLEVYCCTDQQCICYLCMIDEHRGHETVSAAAGRAEIQKQMGETQREFQQQIQMREKELQELSEAVGSVTSSAQSAVEDSERIFTEMIRSIEKRRSEVTKLIRDQEKAAVSQAKGDMERLEQEIVGLKRRQSELEQLLRTEDHIHFLQRCHGLPVTPEAGFGPRISVSPRYDFRNVRKVVSELKDQLETVCEKKLAEIHHPVTEDAILPVLVPRTRAEFLQSPAAVRIVLLGRTGTGKSSAGNVILGEKKFAATVSVYSVTKDCQTEEGNINGINISVTDTPGIFGSERSEEDLKYSIISCVTECAPGPHVFILVLRVGRYTREDNKAVSGMLQLFGKEALKHTAVLFTHGDDLNKNETIESFVKRNKDLMQLVDRCGGRVHVIDCKHWKIRGDADPLEKLMKLIMEKREAGELQAAQALEDLIKRLELRSSPPDQEPSQGSGRPISSGGNLDESGYRNNIFQVNQLLTTIDIMVTNNGGRYYTNESLRVIAEAIELEVNTIKEQMEKREERAEGSEIRRQARERVRTKVRRSLLGDTTGAASRCSIC